MTDEAVGADASPLRRRSIRLPEYDYTLEGAYFFTVCTHGRECLFGNIIDDEMHLNVCGHIVDSCWISIPNHFPGVECDAWVIMPNHVHGIILITDPPPARALDCKSVRATHASPPHEPPLSAPPARARHASPLRNPDRHASPLRPNVSRPRGPKPHSLGAIIGAFKSAATRRINAMRSTPGAPVWHRNYFERIIRNETECARIRDYIEHNPARWAEDRENPHGTA